MALPQYLTLQQEMTEIWLDSESHLPSVPWGLFSYFTVGFLFSSTCVSPSPLWLTTQTGAGGSRARSGGCAGCCPELLVLGVLSLPLFPSHINNRGRQGETEGTDV